MEPHEAKCESLAPGNDTCHISHKQRPPRHNETQRPMGLCQLIMLSKYLEESILHSQDGLSVV